MKRTLRNKQRHALEDYELVSWEAYILETIPAFSKPSLQMNYLLYESIANSTF